MKFVHFVYKQSATGLTLHHFGSGYLLDLDIILMYFYSYSVLFSVGFTL